MNILKAYPEQLYHLSVGAVLVNPEGLIACHHYSDIRGCKDLYILMRETMEAGESPFASVERGLREEFGATAHIAAFLGSLVGQVWGLDRTGPPEFEKTTIYFLARVDEFDANNRDKDDAEAASAIEWHAPDELAGLMEDQGKRLRGVDMNEAEIVRRAAAFMQNA